MVKICSVCGQLYYKQEDVCNKCKSEDLKLIKNMEISCGFNKFEIKGNY